ncbi:hypothetical protein F5X96DRAFT_661309 [Biscogniauxia mediterranea]|nr:hypothetical protein F5X96DRAFT_661309 [Biscogniauxia mediterranea]
MEFSSQSLLITFIVILRIIDIILGGINVNTIVKCLQHRYGTTQIYFPSSIILTRRYTRLWCFPHWRPLKGD